MKNVLNYLKDRWGQIVLGIILLTIIALNFKPGYLILGNDNFTPEVNPKIILKRSFFSPAWRSYRVLGIPSDSEEADIFRTLIFWVLTNILPSWVVSQGYLFLAFFTGSFSLGFLSKSFGEKLSSKKESQIAFFFGGLLYLASLLTSWVFFYPLHLFVAAYAFLPLVLWRLKEFFQTQSVKNAFFLFLSSLLLSTSALTATMFMVCALVILAFLIIFWVQIHRSCQFKKTFIIGFWGVFLTLGIQFYWFSPFLTYVKTNNKALQDSLVNREITTTTIENEIKNNTALNSFRYYFSWIETKEDSKTYTFSYRNWYRNSLVANLLSLLPLILAIVGSFYILSKRNLSLLIISFTAFLGWFLIKGVNPPLGFIFEFFQKNIPLFAQVFRWQSSKFWPFLATTIPLLGAIGTVSIIKYFKNRIFCLLFLILLSAGCLVFVHPYFKGDLIRDKVFVKIPKEYYLLSEYLEKNDKFSRIYLAPEANTLYFRNYSWGFWGSVILNYLLPNPLVEKALVTGSYENEQAFNLLKLAYYSESPLLFAKTLSLYDIPLILSDKNASKGEVGYRYDWSVHKKVVEENPYFTKIWQEGNLTLYKIKDEFLKIKKELQLVSSDHNWLALNTILTASEPFDYFSSTKKVGLIYPFALNYQKINFEGKEIVASLNYNQKPVSFQWNINPEQEENSPIKLEYDFPNNQVKLSPALYYFSVNSQKIIPPLPSLASNLEQQPEFLSLGTQVIDLKTNHLPESIDIAYKKALQPGILKKWSQEFKAKQFSSDDELALDKDSIIQINLTSLPKLENDGSLCIWSVNLQACFNPNLSFNSLRNLPKTTISIPKVFEKGDKLKIFINLKNENNPISFENIILRLYQNSEEINLTENEKESKPAYLTIHLKLKDTFSLHFPLTIGQNSFHLEPENEFFPKANIVPFEENGGGGKITFLGKNSLLFDIKEGNISLYPQLERIDPRNGLALIAFSGENLQAIPASVSLREVKQEFDLYKRKIQNGKDTFFDFIILPEEVRSYILEVFSTGIGPRSSINRIDSLAFQIIPQQWLETKLIPQNENLVINQIVSIPQAISPNWLLLGVKGEPIRINGWKQGWIVEKQDKFKIIFWPNILAYFGYLIILVSFGVLIIYPLIKQVEEFLKKKEKSQFS